MVTQEVHTFAGTLREDLNLARPDATDEEIRNAVARWCAAMVGFLARWFRHGSGEQGMRLSPVIAQQLA